MGRFINADGYINANGDMLGFNMFAYCSNNPVMYLDYSGQFVILGIVLTSDALFKIITSAIIAIAAIDAISSDKSNDVITLPPITVPWGNPVGIIKIKDHKKSVPVPISLTGEIAASKIKKHKQAVFPENPYDFHPRGLIMKEYPGTKNGRIIEWKDPLSGIKIFEWNEDFHYGAHYHVMLPEWNGAHKGIHYKPGFLVPEPWNTIYFGR